MTLFIGRGNSYDFHEGERGRCTRVHGEWQAKLVGEEVLRGDLAHVDAHADAAAVLEVPALGDEHPAPLLDAVDLDLDDLGGADEPAEEGDGEFGVELARPAGGREELLEVLGRAGREHGEQHLAHRLLLLRTRAARHHSPRHVHEALVVPVPHGPLLPLLLAAAAGARGRREFLHLAREEAHEGALQRPVPVLRLLPHRRRRRAPHDTDASLPRPWRRGGEAPELHGGPQRCHHRPRDLSLNYLCLLASYVVVVLSSTCWHCRAP
jgi:hypothetical protein